MKQKTKLLTTIFLGIFLSLGYLAAQNFLPAEPLDEFNYCSEEADMYLNEDNDEDELPDYFLYLRSNFRLFKESPVENNAGQILQFSDPNDQNNTRVFYYVPEPNILTKKDVTETTYSAIDNTTFKRASWVFPYNQRVRGIDTLNTRVNFERPLTTGESTTVSILYRYKYTRAVFPTTTPISPYRYNAVNSWNFSWLTSANYVDRSWPTRSRSSVATAEYCKNYTMHRCGDGIMDTYSSGGNWINEFTGEVCDDGELNGQAGYCNDTCTWTGAGGFFCGDEIINDGSSETVVLSWNGLYYGPTYMSGNEDFFETCDDGNDPADLLPWGDGLINQDGIDMFCSSICFDNFTEAFVEVFINE